MNLFLSLFEPCAFEVPVVYSIDLNTYCIIFILVVPVLLLILIFGIAIAVVRFLVKKK